MEAVFIFATVYPSGDFVSRGRRKGNDSGIRRPGETAELQIIWFVVHGSWFMVGRSKKKRKEGQAGLRIRGYGFSDG
jgi:hypothetical protein